MSDQNNTSTLGDSVAGQELRNSYMEWRNHREPSEEEKIRILAMTKSAKAETVDTSVVASADPSASAVTSATRSAIEPVANKQDTVTRRSSSGSNQSWVFVEAKQGSAK